MLPPVATVGDVLGLQCIGLQANQDEHDKECTNIGKHRTYVAGLKPMFCQPLPRVEKSQTRLDHNTFRDVAHARAAIASTLR